MPGIAVMGAVSRDLGDLPFDPATISAFLLVLCRTSRLGRHRAAGRRAQHVQLSPASPSAHRPGRPHHADGPATSTCPEDIAGYVAAIVAQVLIGLALGFITGVLLSAIEMAGSLADLTSGFSFGSQIDPINGNQSAVFSRLLNMAGLALLAATDGLSHDRRRLRPHRSRRCRSAGRRT